MSDTPPPPPAPMPPPPPTTNPQSKPVVSPLIEKRMSSLAWRNGRGSSREYSIEIDGKQIWFSQRVKSELIGFGTGGSVWNGAIVLCKYLEKKYGNGNHRGEFEGKTILELGSGTGVAGIVCAHLMKGAKFILTDQAQVLPLIKENLERNVDIIPELKDVSVQELNWGPDVSHLNPPPPYDYIIACECVAPIFRLDLLIETLIKLTGEHTTIILAYEHRSEVCRVEFFQKAMEWFDFELVPQEELHEKYCADDIEIWLIRKKKQAAGK